MALSLTALMAVGRFETYQAPLGRRTHERAVSVDDEAASIDTHSSPAPGRWGGVGASLGASRRRATASWWSSSWPAPLWVYYALSGNGERDRPQTPRTPPKREPTGDRRSPSTGTRRSRLRLAGLNARSSDNQVDSTRHAAQRPTAKATSPPSPAQAETATSIRYTHAHSTLHTAVGVSALTCPRSYSLTVQGITGIVHTGG